MGALTTFWTYIHGVVVGVVCSGYRLGVGRHMFGLIVALSGFGLSDMLSHCVFSGTHPKLCIVLLRWMFVAVMRLPWGKAGSEAQHSLWQLNPAGSAHWGYACG